MRFALVLALSLSLACGDDDGTILVDGGSDSGRVDGGGSTPDAGRDGGIDAGNEEEDAGSELDAGSDAGESDAGTDAGETDAGTDAGETDAGTDAGPTCTPLPDDGAPAVEIMDELTATPTWNRPEEGETTICEVVTEDDFAYDTFVFCNPYTYELECLISHVGVDGEGGTLEDPYLFTYDGTMIPSDVTTCSAENDDDPFEEVLDSFLSVTVPAGGNVTIVPSTFDAVTDEFPGVGTYTLTIVCGRPGS
ncbi:MAG: hypothetical protein H6721_27095 [Sandaracinus sp.]|nr:hypothetical protein [Sandaracinus sp.]